VRDIQINLLAVMRYEIDDSSGLMATPGLVDLHVHYREPGNNPSETIESGTHAAAVGGFVFTADMSNNPGNPTWTPQALLEKHAIAEATAWIPGTFNSGANPENPDVSMIEEMAYMSLLFKLYGGPTTGNIKDWPAQIFRRHVREWHGYAPDQPIGFHPGKTNLEDMIGEVAHDLRHPLIVHHVENTSQVALVTRAKKEGLPVTCAVTPQQLVKTEHDTRSEGWFARLQPPLTDAVQARRLTNLLDRGYIDYIESDHAPHLPTSKIRAEEINPEANPPSEGDQPGSTCYGFPGIEFSASQMFYMASRGFISMERVVDAMSVRPAEALGIELSQDTKVVWDMELHRIKDEDVVSGAGWTPFAGKLALGKAKTVTISGVDVYSTDPEVETVHDPRVITQRGSVI
jgi:dihydroorotase